MLVLARKLNQSTRSSSVDDILRESGPMEGGCGEAWAFKAPISVCLSIAREVYDEIQKKQQESGAKTSGPAHHPQNAR